MTNYPAKILALFVKLYQVTVGTAFTGHCRYYPTCSEYTRQAFLQKGAIKGLFMGIWRILRCNPWSGGGYDPVK
jgi:putative membrane protein insertion efficiency factor